MLAAVYEKSGDSSVLQVRDVPRPEPGAGQVRVKIAVSGVNPTDWKRRLTAAPAAGQLAVPNQDGAGTIDAVGAGVESSRVGQRVWVLLAADDGRWGTAAEYSVVPAQYAVPLPDSASFDLGASLGVPALTAWHCLRIAGGAIDRTVLVAGGAGAVGHAAIQLARYQEARHVIATVSGPEKAALARESGAHTVVNYRQPDAVAQIREAAPEGVDTFVEVAIDQNLELDLSVAAPYAGIASYAADRDARVDGPVRTLMAACISLQFMLLYAIKHEHLHDAIIGTSAALSAGALTTQPLHRYPLERIADAHDAVQQGATGKVLVDLQ